MRWLRDDVRGSGSGSGSGCAAPRPGSAKYELARLGETFPSQRLVDQTVKTVTTILVVKLKRGKERKMTVRAKTREELPGGDGEGGGVWEGEEGVRSAV